MDVKLEHLIEKIKRDGVDEAERISQDTVLKAREDATSIVEQARRESVEIIRKAETEANNFQEKAVQAMAQAQRDITLSLKEQIVQLFDRVFKRKVAETLTPALLNEMILKLVDQWSVDSTVELTLNEADRQALQNLLFAAIHEDMKETVTLLVSDRLNKGFRIRLHGESVYYDFSDETIAEVLRAMLSSELKKVLDENDG